MVVSCEAIFQLFSNFIVSTGCCSVIIIRKCYTYVTPFDLSATGIIELSGVWLSVTRE